MSNKLVSDSEMDAATFRGLLVDIGWQENGATLLSPDGLNVCHFLQTYDPIAGRSRASWEIKPAGDEQDGAD